MAFQPFTQLPKNNTASTGFQPFTQMGNHSTNNPGYTPQPTQTVIVKSPPQIGKPLNFIDKANNAVSSGISNLLKGVEMKFTKPQEPLKSPIPKNQIAKPTTNPQPFQMQGGPLPESEQVINQLIADPFNLHVNPKKAITDGWKSITDAWQQEEAKRKALQTIIGSNAPLSKKGAAITNEATGILNLGTSPFSAIFNGANDVPVLGAVAKYITIPFVFGGEVAKNTVQTEIDHVPFFSQETKNNLKPAVGAFYETIVQLLGGKVLGGEHLSNLTKRFGKEEATTIVTQAQKVVDEQAKGVQHHQVYSPQEMRNKVFQNDLENTSEGKALIKSTMEAEQQGQSIEVGIPKIPEYKPQEVTEPKVDLQVKANPNLSEEHKAIETNLTNDLQNHYQESVDKYNALPDTEGGKILSADSARELSSEYTADRSKSEAVQEPASAFIKKVYADKLKEPIQDGKDTVLMMAGGTGAGKSTAIENVASVQKVKDNAQFVLDTNSANESSTIAKVQQALDAGRKVAIAYIHRDPVTALERGALPRAMRMGRTVPLEAHLNTHIGALESIGKIADHFKDNPNFGIVIIDNTGEKEEAHVMALDKLRNIRYNKDELRQQLHESLDKQYETNKISETVYNATKNSEGESNSVQATSKSNGTGNSEKSQQEHTSTEGENSRTYPESSPNGKSYNELSTGKDSTNSNTTSTETPTLTRKVLTGNEVRSIRDVIEAKLNHVRQTASNEADFSKGVDELVSDTENRAQGDKQVLSALRTELNKEMYSVVGSSGDYKADYAHLQEMMKDTTGTGAMLNNLDDHIRSLDTQLVSASEKPREAPAFIKQRQQTQSGKPMAQEPVGQGNIRDSAAYKRLVEHLQDKSPEELKAIGEQELKYHQMNIKDQAEKALEFVQKNPDKAYRVAKGYENPPEGIVTHAVNMALADHALAEKNYGLAADLHKSGSLALTRAGQEIVMERGRYSDTSPHAFMRQLINTRIQRLGNMTEGVKIGKFAVGDTIKSANKRAVAKIDTEVQKLKETLTKEQRKIKTAQSIIDQLICK